MFALSLNERECNDRSSTREPSTKARPKERQLKDRSMVAASAKLKGQKQRAARVAITISSLRLPAFPHLHYLFSELTVGTLGKRYHLNATQFGHLPL